MSYVQRSIHSFFEAGLLSSCGALDLIRSAVIRAGELVPRRTLLSNEERPAACPYGRRTAVSIGFCNGLSLEFQVVQVMISHQKFVCQLVLEALPGR